MSATIDPALHAALRRLAIAFGRTLDDEQLDVFADALDELSVFDIVRACREIEKHERFFPRPVVVRAYVDRLRRTAAAPALPPVAQYINDPISGERVELWTCGVCQDRGFVPVAENGTVMSWDQVRGVGAFIGAPANHHHVRYCTACTRLRVPSPKVTRRSFDDEQDDRKR